MLAAKTKSQSKQALKSSESQEMLKPTGKEASYSVPEIGASNTKSDDARSVLSRTKHKDLVQS